MNNVIVDIKKITSSLTVRPYKTALYGSAREKPLSLCNDIDLVFFVDDKNIRIIQNEIANISIDRHIYVQQLPYRKIPPRPPRPNSIRMLPLHIMLIDEKTGSGEEFLSTNKEKLTYLHS